MKEKLRDMGEKIKRSTIHKIFRRRRVRKWGRGNNSGNNGKEFPDLKKDIDPQL